MFVLYSSSICLPGLSGTQSYTKEFFLSWALAYRNIVLLTFYALLPLSYVLGAERGPGLYPISWPSWGLWLTYESRKVNPMLHTTCQEFKWLVMGSRLIGWPTNLLKQFFRCFPYNFSWILSLSLTHTHTHTHTRTARHDLMSHLQWGHGLAQSLLVIKEQSQHHAQCVCPPSWCTFHPTTLLSRKKIISDMPIQS